MKIINDIQQYTLDDYEETINEFISEFGQDGISLYKFGNIRHPSISDLDLLAVIDDKITDEQLLQKFKRFHIANEKRRYLFFHGVFILRKSQFKLIKYFHTVQNLKCIYGEELEVEEISKEIRETVEKVNFLNFSFFIIFGLRKLLTSKQSGLRSILLLLNNAKYSIEYLAESYPCLKELSNSLNSVRTELTKESYSDKNFKNNLKKLIKVTSVNLEKYYFEYADNILEEIIFPKNRIQKYTLFFASRFFIKLPTLLIYHGASYAKVFDNPKSIYKLIHEKKYPVSEFDISDNTYRDVMKKHMEVVYSAEQDLKRHKLECMLPLMNSFQPPIITFKVRMIFLMAQFFTKISNIK